jgi:hypothetical protein
MKWKLIQLYFDQILSDSSSGSEDNEDEEDNVSAEDGSQVTRQGRITFDQSLPVSHSVSGRNSSPWYLFTKDFTTTIKVSFLLYSQLNAVGPQVRMEVLLHAGILSFDHFKIYD